jgi:hypothetical protein
MNGVKIASSENLAGTWRFFNLDVTSAANPGQTNSLAVEIFHPQPRVWLSRWSTGLPGAAESAYRFLSSNG